MAGSNNPVDLPEDAQGAYCVRPVNGKKPKPQEGSDCDDWYDPTVDAAVTDKTPLLQQQQNLNGGDVENGSDGASLENGTSQDNKAMYMSLLTLVG